MKKRTKYFREYKRRWRGANPLKVRGENAMRALRGKGLLPKLGKCYCGAPARERHHGDYSKPNSVRGLCRRCHARIHAREKMRKAA